MRLYKGVLALVVAMSALAPTVAEAQDTSRIIMRRPLAKGPAAGEALPTCGTPGQPACAMDCDYVGAIWEVGQWSGSACGQGGTVSRVVTCKAIRPNGDRVSKPDSFCLQDSASFASSCNSSPSYPNPGVAL